MKLTCAIIDDEPLAASLLESYAMKTPFLEVKGKYNSALNAMNSLHNEPVQVLFLDIQMPELSGMEFSKMLPPETKVIFTTAFEQYAVDSYRVNALDYLLKPISYSDFLKAAQKAYQWFELLQRKNEEPAMTSGTENEVERIFVKTEYKLVQIELNRILYIEGLKDYVKIYLEGETHPVLSLISMKMVEDMLPSSRFVRVHRSYIIQLEKIKVIERNRIVFGKEYIPISDNYKQKFFDFLAQHSILLAK
ncbi:LytTR family DNA-binding domain-containing protein [Parabacteroides sp. AD58]|uniref:LytTR family DNA-binding domain-containing protein n=1 Tax=Parabacteroides absconsus TaxID=2951805 RepID=A0ABZ2IHP2_9BACT|nr:LytTR family DNA-binding domain-containing protein [Parabacteroides sp. AD58]MCM6902576.1 LytTR family DNA-binding domain-containing protein [Parabacteroides sp. AD58]